MPTLLVVYSSWTGATRGVAEAVAADLRSAGFDVTLAAAKDVRDLTPYAGVIFGTGVHAGKLPGPALAFMRRFAAPLRTLPLAAFLVCLTMVQDTEETRATARGYLEPLWAAAPGVQPVDVALFAGAVLKDTPEYARLFPLLKIPVKSMAESEPDHRDWAAIHAWAQTLPARFAPVPA